MGPKLVVWERVNPILLISKDKFLSLTHFNFRILKWCRIKKTIIKTRPDPTMIDRDMAEKKNQYLITFDHYYNLQFKENNSTLSHFAKS